MQQSTTPSATSPQSFHSQFSSTTGHRTEQPSGQLDNSNTSGYYFPEISWKEAFGSGGLPGDPPLLQELGINLAHIGSKVRTFHQFTFLEYCCFKSNQKC